ncbi:MAG: sulfotransferase [Rhizobiales bacterium]|nr:sulfotransferase [Hyphomicrobiales bacterium]
MNATAPWLDNAVLVYGPRKAGTTLFQNLLDGTDALAVYPAELKLKYFVKSRPEGLLVDSYRARSRMAEVVSPHFSIERYRSLWQDNADGSLAELIRRDMAHVLAASDRRAEPKLWAAKEVGGRTDAILAEWRRLFPQGRVLFILRDPLMVTRAVLNDRRRKERELSIWQIARETIDPLRVVATAVRHLGDSGTFAIAYEDLVADTSATMRRVARFLGIPFEGVLTRPTLFGEPIVVRTASRAERDVFRSDEKWDDGLTPRERRIVSATTLLAGLAGLRVSYVELRRRLNA